MRRLIALALIALAAQAGAASAAGPGYAYGHGSTGAGFKLRLFGGIGPSGLVNGGPYQQLGPWYHYWPYEAHFQTPALPQYPYWPAPQTLPPGQGFPGAPNGGHPYHR